MKESKVIHIMGLSLLIRNREGLMVSHPEEDEGGGCCWLYPEKDDCWL